MNAITKRYEAAVKSFVDKVRSDPNVIAVMVAGSVYHGTVWRKSDVDMAVVVRDQKLDRRAYGVYEDGILINVNLVPRSELKRGMEKSLGGLFGHSIDATTKVVYTSDDSLYDYVEENRTIGVSDAEKAVFTHADWLLGLMEKIEKWLVVKNDAVYARYYVLKAADAIANMEVCSRLIPPTREAILQAAELNPPLMEKFYYAPMRSPMNTKEIYALLKEMEAYVLTHMDAIMNVVNEFFGDGEIKSGTHISTHFNSDLHFLHPILDFLCDRGVLDKVSQTIRLTPKGRMTIEETAFIMQK